MHLDIVLRAEVLERIAQSSLEHRPLEAGGLLLGYRKDACIEIVDCTEPSESDFATPNRFVRQDAHHIAYAKRCWAASGQRIDWVGEWHSHPDSSPNPSCTDLRSWKKIVRRHGAPMVYLICGATSLYSGLMRPGGRAPEPLFETQRNERDLLLERTTTE